MALQKQLAHINITGNLERKDDSALVIPSKLTTADNVVFDDASSVIVRGGQSKVSTSLITGNAYRNFVRAGQCYIEHSAGLHSATSVQVRNPNTGDGHTAASHFRRTDAATRRVAGFEPRRYFPSAGAVSANEGNNDCALLGGVMCYVYETYDSRYGSGSSIKVQLVTEATGALIYSGVINPASGDWNVKPRVVGVGTTFYIFYGTFTNGATNTDWTLKGATLTTSGTLSASSTVVAGCSTSPAYTEQAGETNPEIFFDAAATADATKLGIVVKSDPTTLTFRNVTLADITAGTSATATVTEPLSLTALFSKDNTGDYILHAFYGIGTNVAKARGANFTDSVLIAETTVGTAGGGTVVGRLAAYESSTTLIYLAYDSLSEPTTNVFSSVLRVSSFTHGYASLSEGAGPDPWLISGRIGVVNSRLYLPMAFVSTQNQTTTYVIDLSSVLLNLGVAGSPGAPPHVVARLDYGEGALCFSTTVQMARWTPAARVASSPVSGNTMYVPYIKFERDLRVVGTVNETNYALARAALNFSSQLGSVEVNNLAVLAGGCPHIFDGINYTEEGFHHAPEIVAGTTGGASGTYDLGVTAGTHTVCCTVVWQDAQGNWHESAPSNEVTYTVTGATDQYITPVVVDPPTQKNNARLAWYKTLRSSTDTTLYAWVGQDGITVDESDLAAGEALYTTGDVLPNEPMPACRQLTLFQGRVVASGTEDGSGVAWSKVSERGYGVEFCSSDPLHRTRVPAALGRAVGAQELDDKLFVVCERGAGIIYGQGPSSTGLAGSYSDFNTVVTETGCDWDSPKSIVRAPEGVWFRSPFGIRLISRQGSLARGQDGKQVGAEVDDLVSGTCVAVAGDAKQQIRFYQSAGTVLVWDYQWAKWTRFTDHANVDACFADDRFYHVSNVSSVALLRYYDETAIRDVSDAGTAATVFSGTIETAWLQFAGIQGFQRIYRLMMLGKNSTTGSVALRASFYYDFGSTTDTDDIISTTVIPNDYLVQLQHHLIKQKCEALKVRVEMLAGNDASTGRFRLTDLTLQVGVKPGYYKLPSSQRV